MVFWNVKWIEFIRKIEATIKESRWFDIINDNELLKDFYRKLAEKISLKKVIDGELPYGVTAQIRTEGEREFLFISNFTPEEKIINLGKLVLNDMVTGEEIKGYVELDGYAIRIFKSREH